jgi:hypothetical protein
MVKHSLAVRVDTEPSQTAVHALFILSVVIVETADFTAGSGRVVGYRGALLLMIA